MNFHFYTRDINFNTDIFPLKNLTLNGPLLQSTLDTPAATVA